MPERQPVQVHIEVPGRYGITTRAMPVDGTMPAILSAVTQALESAHHLARAIAAE